MLLFRDGDDDEDIDSPSLPSVAFNEACPSATANVSSQGLKRKQITDFLNTHPQLEGSSLGAIVDLFIGEQFINMITTTTNSYAQIIPKEKNIYGQMNWERQTHWSKK